MITTQGISKKYNHTVLNDISLTISAGNTCCLLGKNGAGKSTLLNIIAGIARPDKGVVYINGRRLQPHTVFAAGEIGIVSQTDNLINQLTGYQFLVFQCLIFDMPRITMHERIDSLAAAFFEDPLDMQRAIASYSSGMRMKLRIMAALIHNPGILLLDEPFANLDPVAADRLVEVLKKFSSKSNSAALISSHDLMYVDKLATHICVLNETTIVFNGTKDDFTQNGALQIDKTLLGLITTPGSTVKELNWLV